MSTLFEDIAVFPQTSIDGDSIDPDDEESQTPEDVVAVLGFDPANESEEPGVTSEVTKFFNRMFLKAESAGSDCGANAPGGGGFQPGNKCGGNRQQSSGKSQTSDWFDESEIETPTASPATNRQDTEDSLYTAATENLDESDDSWQALMNRGQGLSQAIGAEVVGFEDAMNLAKANDDRSLVVLGGMKSRERAREKVTNKYGGDWSKLADVTRATVSVKRMEDVGGVVEKLRNEAASRGWTIEPNTVANKFERPTAAGYRDVSLLMRAPNGQLAELQINTHTMLYAKQSQGHTLYEEYRRIMERQKITPAMQMRAKELEDEMQALYQDAFDRCCK